MVVRYIRESDEIIHPKRHTMDSAGYDLASKCDMIVKSGEVAKIPTGLRFMIPSGYFGSIRLRSGVSIKMKIAPTAGVIDSDYQGEVMIIVFNYGNEDILIPKNARIAQMILLKYESFEFEEVDEFPMKTERGINGFGSTGV